MVKRFLTCIALLGVLLCACGQQPEEQQPPQIQQQENDARILAQRRDIVESYMRGMTSILWRAQEDILYTVESNVAPEDAPESSLVSIKAGQLYQGMPYSYAGGTQESFLEFAGEPDDKGIYTVSGLTWEAISGNSANGARIGNDCSGAIMQAWSQVGNSFLFSTTKNMVADRGFISVGSYNSDSKENKNTKAVCQKNGTEVMFLAYSQLQKADAIVKYTGSGHARMIVEVQTVYNADGSIDGRKSFVTVLEQTRSRVTSTNDAKRRRYDVALGEYVNLIGGVDAEYSFLELFQGGYLPVTIKELQNSKEPAQPTVRDSLDNPGAETLFSGRLSSNWIIDAVTVTVLTPEGQVVQSATVSADRGNRSGKSYIFDMVKFETDKPATIRGYVDLSLLPPGTYRCKVECRLSKDALVVPVRDFEFSIK